MVEPVTDIVLDAPAGLIRIRCTCENGKVASVEFGNQPPRRQVPASSRGKNPDTAGPASWPGGVAPRRARTTICARHARTAAAKVFCAALPSGGASGELSAALRGGGFDHDMPTAPRSLLREALDRSRPPDVARRRSASLLIEARKYCRPRSSRTWSSTRGGRALDTARSRLESAVRFETNAPRLLAGISRAMRIDLSSLFL
nr:proline racemase family protein [Rhodococcus wratislaviensis]